MRIRRCCDPSLTPTSTPAQSQCAWLPPEEQQRVNKAIDQGVAWLKKTQTPNGSWGRRQHEMGLTALPALAASECGVPADDDRIQQAPSTFARVSPGSVRLTSWLWSSSFSDRAGDSGGSQADSDLCLAPGGRTIPGGRLDLWLPHSTPKQESDLLMVNGDRRPRSSRIRSPVAPAAPLRRDSSRAIPARGWDKGLQGESSADSKLLPVEEPPLCKRILSPDVMKPPWIVCRFNSRNCRRCSRPRNADCCLTIDRTTRTRSLPSLDCWRLSNTICRWNAPAL